MPVVRVAQFRHRMLRERRRHRHVAPVGRHLDLVDARPPCDRHQRHRDRVAVRRRRDERHRARRIRRPQLIVVVRDCLHIHRTVLVQAARRDRLAVAVVRHRDHVRACRVRVKPEYAAVGHIIRVENLPKALRPNTAPREQRHGQEHEDSDELLHIVIRF